MNMNCKSLARVFAAVVISGLVAANACAAMRYVTQTAGGYEWRLALDDVAMTASVGTNLTKNAWSTSPKDAKNNWTYGTSSAVDDKTKVGQFTIPSSFTVDGQTYRVTTIGNRALMRAYMTSLIIPEDVSYLWNCALYQCYNLTDLWFKGHATPSSEFGRNYVSLGFNADTVLENTTSIKNVLVGPNIKHSKNFKVKSATNALALLPYRKDNTTWANVAVGGTTPKVVYYYDLDETAGTITFSPTSATALAEALETLPTIAPQIKTAFGLDAKVVVETPIEEATTIPDAFLASGIPLETTEWVAFTATTQEQLQDVLDACSTSSRILIDPAGATGRLDVPAGRNVAMFMSPDGEVAPERVGFMLIVK